MSIPQSSQSKIRTTPAEALPEAQAPAVSNPTIRHDGVNSIIASMVIKSVSNFAEIYSSKKKPDQEPMKQKNMLQTVYTEYKKPINDFLTVLGGASSASVRPFVGAFKSVLLGHAGNNAYLSGHDFNLYSGPVNALGGAFAGLLSSGLFFKDSALKTGADLLLKNIQSGIKNPKIAPIFRFDPSSMGKALLSIAVSKLTSKLTENSKIHRPENAGTEMTQSDQKYANQLFTGIAYAYTMQAIIGLPGIKEGLADFFIPKFKSEKNYDEMLKTESITTDPAELTKMLAEKPRAKYLAERAKSIRVEIPQQIHMLTAVGLITIATYTLFHKADEENSGNYVRQKNNQ